MIRSKLIAASAVAVLLAACSGDGDDTSTDETTTTEDGTDEAAAPEGDVTGTVTAAETSDDGTVLTVETTEGDEVEVTASDAAYIDAPTDTGGRQRTRLSTWLDNNEFDDTTYTFREFDGRVTDVVAE